jgi:hypothetical protein
MIKLILLASLISLPVIAQDIPETMSEEAAAAVSEPEATVTDPVEETTAVSEPASPVVTTEETPEVVGPEPVAKTEEVVKTPVITTQVPKDEERFNPLESHWVTSFGFEGMKYETINSFSGNEKNYKPNDVELWGGRIGFGGEIYLGAGFLTTTKVEGYYVGTLFAQTLNAGPDDEDEEFSTSKQTGQIYGIDASQSISYIFDMKTKNPIMEEWTYLTVEPFIEVGIGRAKALNRVNYNYDTGTGPTQTDEAYKNTVEDDLINARIGGGFNFTASSGYFLYIKGFVNTFDITNRETKEYTQPDDLPGATVTSETKNAKIDPVTTYAIGGGYKF